MQLGFFGVTHRQRQMKRIIIITALVHLTHYLFAQSEPTIDVVPDPFYDTTSVLFYLPNDDTVSVIIFDRWGQPIDTLIKEQFMSNGIHTKIFVGDTLPQDQYLALLDVDNQWYMKWFTKLDQPVGTNNYKYNKDELKIFPNPTNEKIIIYGLENLKGIIELINQEGKIIRKERINNLSLLTINVSSLEKGIYFIKLQNKNGQIISIKKVIKYL